MMSARTHAKCLAQIKMNVREKKMRIIINK